MNQRRSTSIPSVIDAKGMGHLASQYPSQIKTLLMKVPIKDVEENGLEVVVHQLNDDSDAYA